MPQPWDGSKSRGLRSGDLLAERPKCLELMGAIVAAWSDAESQLAVYYGSLLVGPPGLSNIPSPPGAWAAMETFDMITNYDQRKNMLLVAAQRRRFNQDTVDEFDKRLSKLKKSGDSRIHTAHGRWSVDDDIQDGLVWQKSIGSIANNDPRSSPKVYLESDFRQSLQNIQVASANLADFFWNTINPRLEHEAKFLIGLILAVVKPEDLA